MPYLHIIVRAKKDRDALEHVIENYYPAWGDLISVSTLGGERSEEKIIDAMLDFVRQHRDEYVLVLLGRDDVRNPDKVLKLNLYPNVSVHIVRTSRLRNMRPLEIAVNIEKAKAKLRLKLAWIGSVRAYQLGNFRIARDYTVLEIPPHPLYDIYFVIGHEHAARFSHYVGARLPSVLLVIKRVHDEHDVVLGAKRLVEIVIPENAEPYVRRYFISPREIEEKYSDFRIDLYTTVKLTEPLLQHHVRIAEALLRRAYEMRDPDKVIVPWSGGKDSTAALLLALKVFGRDKVVPIFVDTGLELSLTYRYVEYVSELLRVKPEIEHAGIDKALDERELPTHENRWCTKLKIAALYRAIRRVADKPLIVVGDRDSESLLRLKRPPVRPHEEYLQVAPLKLWSTAMVQLFLLSHRVPLNPLYQLGFYRLGCYICPAYRIWELDIAQEVIGREDELRFEDLLREQLCLADLPSLP